MTFPEQLALFTLLVPEVSELDMTEWLTTHAYFSETPPWKVSVLFLASLHLSLSTHLTGNPQSFVFGIIYMFFSRESHPAYGFYDHLNAEDSQWPAPDCL